jgi:hypothetical protein
VSKLIERKELQLVGRAFGSRRNAWAWEEKTVRLAKASIGYQRDPRHKDVILMVVNGGKMRTKGEQRRRK